MISSITKPKLPIGYSYVLKTSMLEEILIKNNIETDATLVYWKPQIIGSIFEVHYWIPNKNVPSNRLYIRAGALLNQDVPNARDGLLKKVLPEFIAWVNIIEKLEKSSTLYPKRFFNGYYKDNRISISRE